MPLGAFYGFGAGTDEALQQQISQRHQEQLLQLQIETLAQRERDRQAEIQERQRMHQERETEREAERKTKQADFLYQQLPPGPAGNEEQSLVNPAQAQILQEGNIPVTQPTAPMVESLQPGMAQPAQAFVRTPFGTVLKQREEQRKIEQGQHGLDIRALLAQIAQSKAETAQARGDQSGWQAVVDPKTNALVRVNVRTGQQAPFEGPPVVRGTSGGGKISQMGQKQIDQMREALAIFDEMEPALRKMTKGAAPGILPSIGRMAKATGEYELYKQGIDVPEQEFVAQLPGLAQVLGGSAFGAATRAYPFIRKAMEHPPGPGNDPVTNLKRIHELRKAFAKMEMAIRSAEAPQPAESAPKAGGKYIQLPDGRYQPVK